MDGLDYVNNSKQIILYYYNNNTEIKDLKMKCNLEKAAYHEAGHIVAAVKLCGYDCSMATINDEGGGESVIHFGREKPIYDKLLDGVVPAGLSNDDLGFLIDKKSTIIACGPIAEYLNECDFNMNGVLGVEFSGPDMDEIIKLSSLNKSNIQERLDETIKLFHADEFTNEIKLIAEHLLQHKSIDKESIMGYIKS